MGSVDTHLQSYSQLLHYENTTRFVKVKKLHPNWVNVLRRISRRTISTRFTPTRTFISFAAMRTIFPPFCLSLFPPYWVSLTTFLLLYRRMIFRIFSFALKVLFRAAQASAISTSVAQICPPLRKRNYTYTSFLGFLWVFTYFAALYKKRGTYL